MSWLPDAAGTWAQLEYTVCVFAGDPFLPQSWGRGLAELSLAMRFAWDWQAAAVAGAPLLALLDTHTLNYNFHLSFKFRF